MDRFAARRLLLAAAVLCLGLALAGGPPGAASAARSSRAPDVVIDPAALPPGPGTTLVHTDGRDIVVRTGDQDGYKVIRPDLPGRPRLVGTTDRGYVVTTTRASDGASTLWLVRLDGTVRTIRRLPSAATAPRLSPDGTMLAWTVHGRERTRLVAAHVRDGSLIGSVWRKGYLDVADVGRRILVTGFQPSRTLWFRPGAASTDLLFRKRMLQADIRADRAVVAVKDQDDGFDGMCLSYRELRDPSTRFWRSCTDVPLTFSTDRAHMVTTDIRSDGIGPSYLEIRDAVTNTALARYTTPGGYFGDPVWEDADSFVVRVWAGGHAAMVRITTAGIVERVSRVAEVEADNFRALWWTFAEE